MIKYFTPSLTNVHGFQGHREACHSVSWSPNDEKFATGGDDGLVKVWNYRAATEEKALAGHGWDVRCVDWHPSKGLLVSGSKDMLVKFWDPRTGRDLSTLHSHKSTVNAAKWSPNGYLVATGGGDGIIRLFDIRTFRELEPMKAHTKEVNCIEWHPVHHQLFASGDAAGALIYWSLHSPDPSKPETVLSGAHEDAIYSLAFHPLGHLLCSGSKDFTARFWSRARPAGGHESDRWHVGEERAMHMKMYGKEPTGPAVPVSDSGYGDRHRAARDDDGPIGLPGLAKVEPQVGGGGVQGRGPPGLPGLNGGGHAGLPGLGAPLPPPVRSWGADGESLGSRSGGPLPSQAEMLRTVAPGRAPGVAGPGAYAGAQAPMRQYPGPPPPAMAPGPPGGGYGGRAPLPAGYGSQRPSDGYQQQSQYNNGYGSQAYGGR